MKKLARRLLLLLVGGILLSGTYSWYLVHKDYQGYDGEVVVDVPVGYSSREIVELLHDEGVIEYKYAPLVWLYFSPYRGRLQAGEYVFDEPLDAADVFAVMAEGRVRLYTLTIPEGFRVDQIAQRWEDSGFGDSEGFLSAASAALPTVQVFDPDAVSVEGYLFPETYSFPRDVTADQAVAVMIEAFQETVERLEREVPRSDWPLDLHETLVLASLVESEVAVGEERALVASVFMNRLNRNMRLECDPTVVYALLRRGDYRGRLLLVDLDIDSPYNTYRYPDLPPGAISNPGYDSLLAAIRPSDTDYIFFVRTEGGRHAFSRTLAEHNRAVAAYRLMTN